MRKENRKQLQYDLRNHLKILSLKNAHLGKQCVIMATGPSLNEVDLSLLDGHPFVFGVNGAYKSFDDFRYFFCSSANFFLCNENDICALPVETIFLSSHIPLRKGRRFVYLRIHEKPQKNAIFSKKQFRWNLMKTLYWGPTVLLDIAIPTALWMGFSEIVLLGADYSLKNYRHAYAEQEHNTLEPTDCESEMVLAHASFEIVAETLRRMKAPPRLVNCSPLSDLRSIEKDKLDTVIRRPRQ